MKTDTNVAGQTVPLNSLVGKLVEMGDLHDTNGDLVRGLLIECIISDLRDCNLRLYGMVSVSNRAIDGLFSVY